MSPLCHLVCSLGILCLGASASAAAPGAPGDTPRPLPAPGGAAPTAPAPASVSESDRARAVELFQKGNRALDGGDYRGALALFQQAYGIFPSPKLLFNMAQAFNELGRLVEAVEAYERFVREFRKAENPQLFSLAHKRIFALQGQIATIRLETNVVGAAVMVDGKTFGETPVVRPLRFLPGHHAIVVAKAGYERQVLQRKLDAGTTVLRIELLTEAEAIAKREEVHRLTEERRRAEERLQREQEWNRRRQAERQRRFWVAGWAVLGTGLAIMATGTGFGIHNLVKVNYLESRPRGTYWSSVSSDNDAALASRTVFWVGMGVGAALAVTGGAMLFVHARMARTQEAPAKARPAPADEALRSLRVLPTAGPGGVGATLSLQF